jgi:hypothetical protein
VLLSIDKIDKLNFLDIENLKNSKLEIQTFKSLKPKLFYSSTISN